MNDSRQAQPNSAQNKMRLARLCARHLCRQRDDGQLELSARVASEDVEQRLSLHRSARSRSGVTRHIERGESRCGRCGRRRGHDGGLQSVDLLSFVLVVARQLQQILRRRRTLLGRTTVHVQQTSVLCSRHRGRQQQAELRQTAAQESAKRSRAAKLAPASSRPHCCGTDRTR